MSIQDPLEFIRHTLHYSMSEVVRLQPFGVGESSEYWKQANEAMEHVAALEAKLAQEREKCGKYAEAISSLTDQRVAALLKAKALQDENARLIMALDFESHVHPQAVGEVALTRLNSRACRKFMEAYRQRVSELRAARDALGEGE